MDGTRFEAWLRGLTTACSRRSALIGLLGGAFGVVRFAETEAKRGKKKRKKKRGGTVPPPPPPDPPELVYECPGPRGGEHLRPASTRVAQTFVPGSSGPLRRIVFPVVKVPDSLGDYVVQLLAVDGSGVPSHLPQGVLAQAIVPNGAVAGGQSVTVTADFDGPPLVAGTQYAAAISRPGPNNYAAHYRTDSGCSGSVFQADQGKAFIAAIGELDILVSVFIS
jgi:hypothetical protein